MKNFTNSVSTNDSFLSMQALISAARGIVLAIVILCLFTFSSSAQQPDLKFAYNPVSGVPIRFNPQSGIAGSSINVLFQVSNSGPVASTEFKVCYYLSTDNILASSDILLLELLHTGLNPSIEEVNTTLTIPHTLVAGRYFLIALLDCSNQVTETNESNNTLASRSTFEVVAPIDADLRLKPWSGTAGNSYVWVGNENFADGTSSGALKIAPDGNFLLNYTIENARPQRTGPFEVGYYISDDEEITRDDLRIGKQVFSGLSGNSNAMTLNSTATLPPEVGSGNYYFGIIVDWQNSVIENGGGKEDNNVWSRQLEVLNIKSDKIKVWRVRIRIETGSGRYDGTNDPIFAELNGKKTFLNYARNDFQRGHNDWYDLLLDNVSDYGDISGIRLANYPGSLDADALCVAKIQLEVNGEIFFEKDFPGRCDWIDNSEIQIGYVELRQHVKWGTQREPNITDMRKIISKEDISSLVQAIVGTEIQWTRASWGNFHGEPVEIKRLSNNTLEVDLDLVADVPGPDPDLDVNFKLRFQCVCEGLEIEAYDVKATIKDNLATDFIGLFRDIQGEINDGLKGFGFKKEQDLGIFCPMISIKANADVELLFQAAPELTLTKGDEHGLKVKPGNGIRASHIVTNTGNYEAKNYIVRNYITDDLNSSLTFLGQSMGESVDLCRPTYAWSELISIPSELTCGKYYLVSKLFLDENSSLESEVTRDIIVGLPELEVSLTSVPLKVDRGTRVIIKPSVTNEGIFASNNTMYFITLQSRSVGSETLATTGAPDSWRLLSGTIGRLDPKEEWKSSLKLEIPRSIPKGNYFLNFSVVQRDFGSLIMGIRNDCNYANNSIVIPLRVN